MKAIKVLFLIMLAVLVVLHAAHAGDDVWTKAQSEKYGTKAGGMFLRGLLNVASSPVDLIVHTVDETKAGPAFVGTMGGIGSGRHWQFGADTTEGYRTIDVRRWARDGTRSSSWKTSTIAAVARAASRPRFRLAPMQRA